MNVRRSSLVDIPKALLSSLRRASLSTIPEPRQLEDSTDEAEEYEDNSNVEDGEILMATVMTSNGLCQAIMAVPKQPPGPSGPQNYAAPLKSIMKKQFLSVVPPSINNDEDLPLPAPAPVPAPATSLDAGASQSPTSKGAHLFESSDIHPLATPDKNDMNLDCLTPTDRRARLIINSPVPSPLQQQLQRTHLAPIPPKLSTSPVGRYSSPQGVAIPPDFTPGVQSNNNAYADRGGERVQGLVSDLHRQGSRGNGFSQIQEQQSSNAPSGNHRGGGSGYVSARAQDLSRQYYSSNGPFRSHYYGDINQQDSSGGMRGSLQKNDVPEAAATIAFLGQDAFDNNLHGRILPGISNYDADERMGGSLESMKHEYGYGYCYGKPRKAISFTDTIEIIPAYRKGEYNRRSDKNATFKILTPDLKNEIRDELNSFKMREMAVHVQSMGNTAFH
ncbi:hypothetical protein BC939DRAFT_465977 [Gamsiella multidivaricata]|uniref:uncharacterized protein n=1 Tax=Gamsiella multidivaricata TaxID=101098 RepID=UPI0022211759|nr:uncharacterized protein BC939DRAFT_465977 [Gamsiella multidivaricata]KAG0358660.1 hypothetical protein BGZ54_010336 [Gamsiella multidivaricata]KAI7817389.1 hypothetical protein BC939DRAFT_465977 [Gamsiella multidivaricata]